MPKVLPLIQSCSGCPNRQYSSGGAYDCSLAKETIPKDVVIAPFCPLPDYPSRVIASMEATIRALREGTTLSFTTGVLSLIATRLKTTLRADYRGIDIILKDGSVVYLPYDDLTIDTDFGWTIRFKDGGVKYKLHLAGDKPSLHRTVSVPGLEGEHWQECDLPH